MWVLMRADHGLERPLGDARRVLPHAFEASQFNLFPVLSQFLGCDRRIELR
jgi:hypothetical protein